MNGEIMEISGLDSGPNLGEAPTSPWIWYIGALLLGAVTGFLVHRVQRNSSLGDLVLGMIRPARTRDLDPNRPRRDQKWVLWDSKGKRILGRHRRRSGAERQEQAIQIQKHRRG